MEVTMTYDREDMSNIFTECEAYLRTALARWRKQLPELYEDAFQEGMIQCWRDVEAGVSPKLKVLRRASMSANKFCHRNGEYYFGKPRKSRDGLRSNQKTVDKVQVYLEETKGIRDGVWPQPKEVADALGIARSSAQKILKDIKEGRIDHMVYQEDGRYDWNHYSQVSVEVLSVNASDGGEVRHWSDDKRIPSETFEDELVGNLDMELLLNKLSDRHKTVLYMYFYEGYSVIDIGRHFGFTTNISTKGDRQLKNAISQARMILAPYSGECGAGHPRTADNTHVKQRVDGVWYRVCTTCKKGAMEKAHETVKREGIKTGRKEKLICPKGHTKDRRDSRGSLRCSQCRKDAQKRYYDNHKEYYQEYQRNYKKGKSEE